MATSIKGYPEDEYWRLALMARLKDVAEGLMAEAEYVTEIAAFLESTRTDPDFAVAWDDIREFERRHEDI